MKLELKHLTPYLPYNLTGLEYIGAELHELTMTQTDARALFIWNRCDNNLHPSRIDCKPILKPLNLLSKHDVDFMYFDIIATDNDMYGNRMEFDDWLNETDIYHLPFCIYRQLLEWHYDLFGLIKKGLAISYNDIKKQ